MSHSTITRPSLRGTVAKQHFVWRSREIGSIDTATWEDVTMTLGSLPALKKVQERLGTSKLLACFTNTSKYQQWLSRNGSQRTLLYHVTNGSKTLGHENTTATIYHQLQQKSSANVESSRRIFYLRPSKTGFLPSSSSQLETDFVIMANFHQAKICQILQQDHDMKRQIIPLKPHWQKRLVKGFLPNSNRPYLCLYLGR